MIFLFWFSLVMIFYIYVGYPLCLLFLGFFVGKKIKKKKFEPEITILISAYNEAKSIAETIKNKISIDYPSEKLHILVISDGSDDGTDEIVSNFGGNVKLIRQEERAGKTAALNMAISQVDSEIIVFSDANSIYDSKALKKLITNFSDSRVGYATGKMIYTNPDGSIIGDGCSAYMKYENRLRKLETRVGSIVGVDGGIDAVRRQLYKPMAPDQLPDFVLPLNVVKQGYRVVYESEAILKEPSLKEPKDEYRMRVRVSLRAIWALSDMRKLLSFKNFKLFAWQLLSHKVLRYLCFIFLISAYMSNFFLWTEGWIYKIFFLIQSLSYLGAITSQLMDKNSVYGKISYFLYYFLLLNIASAHAVIKFLFRQKIVTWTPRKG